MFPDVFRGYQKEMLAWNELKLAYKNFQGTFNLSINKEKCPSKNDN